MSKKRKKRLFWPRTGKDIFDGQKRVCLPRRLSEWMNFWWNDIHLDFLEIRCKETLYNGRKTSSAIDLLRSSKQILHLKIAKAKQEKIRQHLQECRACLEQIRDDAFDAIMCGEFLLSLLPDNNASMVKSKVEEKLRKLNIK